MFFTEAFLDLAEDEQLMELMVEANFVSVFIGIESPNEASLQETKKFQNVRKGGSMVEKVRTVQRAGLDVECRIILGFDHDDASIFAAQKAFLDEARDCPRHDRHALRRFRKRPCMTGWPPTIAWISMTRCPMAQTESPANEPRRTAGMGESS